MTPFTRGLLRQPTPVLAWVIVLAGTNMLAVLFIDRTEAKVVLGTLLVGAVAMEIITATVGFTRLLGLGHLLWYPMLVYLWGRLDLSPADEPFGLWLRALLLVNGISLVLDTLDVVRYVRGERAETVRWD